MFTGMVIILATIWALPIVCKGASKIVSWICGQFQDSWSEIQGIGKKGK